MNEICIMTEAGWRPIFKPMAPVPPPDTRWFTNALSNLRRNKAMEDKTNGAVFDRWDQLYGAHE